MGKQIILIALLAFLFTSSTCLASAGANRLPSTPSAQEQQIVDMVLKPLKQNTSELKSYQCRLEYLVKQPLFESQTLRKGMLYYQKIGTKSQLRINFKTLKQDDEKEQKQVQQYIFDGIWLTHLDYQIKKATKRQLAPANEPIEAFDLVARNFPIIGFAGTDKLKKEFEITLAKKKESKKAGFIQLHAKVKPNSIYKDDYKTFDFWVDERLGLVTKIVAVSVEDDIYQLKLIKPKVNKELEPKVFDFRIPKGFGQPQIIPLKKKAM